MNKNDFEHAKSEAVLKEAALEFENEFYDEITENFTEEEPKFSQKHEKTMRKLFAKTKGNPVSVLKRSVAVAAVLIICFTAAMQVEAFAQPVKEALFGHPAAVQSTMRVFDVYHPEILGDPIGEIIATVTFEFTGQTARILHFSVEKEETEDCALEVNYVVAGDTVTISYVCSDTRDEWEERAENPGTYYSDDYFDDFGAVIIEETLVLTVTPDGNINGFV